MVALTLAPEQIRQAKTGTIHISEAQAREWVGRLSTSLRKTRAGGRPRSHTCDDPGNCATCKRRAKRAAEFASNS